MTLLEYLESLKARPGEAGSPALIVRDDDLTEWDPDTILGPTYDRGPYCLVAGLNRVPTDRLHDGGTLMTGALDVLLYQPTTSGGDLPDPGHMNDLMALIVRAPDSVTEITTGYPIVGDLRLITESDPVALEPGNPMRGRQAIARFQYAIWR